MNSMMLLCLLVFQLSYRGHSVCYSNEPPTLVKMAELTIKKNTAYRFKIQNFANPITILRNQNGTFFNGNFSRVILYGQRKQYEYYSTGFSFKYPAQHRIANVSNELIELQIQYQLTSKASSEWKHKHLAVSVTFLLTEYTSIQTYNMGKLINQGLSNGTMFDLKEILPLLPNLNVQNHLIQMILYKGIHSDYLEQTGFLWLVRKQLLLMSQSQFKDVKSFIYYHIGPQNLNHHGLLSRLSDLNQITELQTHQNIVLTPQI